MVFEVQFKDTNQRMDVSFKGLQTVVDGDIDPSLLLPAVTKKDDGKVLTVVEGKWAAAELPDAGVQFETDETLTLKDGVLSVNTADAVEEDNSLPITSAAVHTTVGNIEVLLKTI